MLLHSAKEKNMCNQYCKKDGQEYQFTTMSTTSTQKNSNLMDLIKSTLLRLEYLANLSPLPESEMVKKMKDICGQSSNASLLILDQNTSYWRTYGDYCQSSLWTESPEGCLDKFSSTFWKSGIVAHGLCMEQPMLAHRTKESEYSLSQGWPTPCVADIFTANLKSTQQKPGSMHSVNLSQCVNWSTPQAGDYRSPNTNPGNRSKSKLLPQSEHALPRQVGGQLNADWVEILMNLPIGWTDIDCEEPQPWPGWPAPMNAGKWPTPNVSDRHKANLNTGHDIGRNYLRAEVVLTSSGQYTYEPPRVVVGQKNRAKRLKCLGNGCCPAQVYPIFKAITEIEGVSK